MGRVSIVVVSYNTREALRRCLACLEPHHETIVVDNASQDGSVEMVRTEFPSVRVIANADNRGFGAANNQGADVASGEFVLYLNSDAYAEPGAVDELAAAMDADTAAVGGRLLNIDGSLQQSAANRLTLWAVLCEQLYLEKLAPRSRWLAPYWVTTRLAEDRPSEVEQVMGACLMVRRGLERFDERFFLYCEDTELCRRLRRHGRIRYVPSARFTHELGTSSSDRRWLAVARYNRGKELYFLIHHGPIAMVLCWLLNRTGALLRLAAWSLKWALGGFRATGSRDQVRLFRRVLAAPLEGPTRSAPRTQG